MTRAAKKRAFVHFCIQCAEKGFQMGWARADSIIPKGRPALSLKAWIEENAKRVFENMEGKP